MITTEVLENITPRPKKENRTAAWRIFHVFYQVRIEQMFLFSEAYSKVAAIYSAPGQKMEISPSRTRIVQSTASENTAATARQMVDVNLTIAGMAELMEEGATIQFPIPENTMSVYQTLHEHLSDWRRVLSDSMNPGKVPEEDLIMLDRLAGHVWQIAKRYVDRGILADPFGLIARAPMDRPGREITPVKVVQTHPTLIQDLFR